MKTTVGYTQLEIYEMAASMFAPFPVIPPLPMPPVAEWFLVDTQDQGHEEEAYYKLGWNCVSEIEGHKLLRRMNDLDAPSLYSYMVMKVRH